MSEVWTIKKLIDWSKIYLSEKGVENARLESEWMLAFVTGLDRMGLYVNFDKPLIDTELSSYREMVARRAKREPIQHILGTQEFFSLEFTVSPSALIPRHDTELLVEEAIRLSPDAKSILDIGTGSGCIAVALAKSLPSAQVIAVDSSPGALVTAMSNAERIGVKVDFREGSLFDPVLGERFDLIVSNPPYIPTADIDTLQPEVREFEPLEALDGGFDGLDFYRLITSQAPKHLNAGGWLMFEVGIHQADAIRGLLAAAGFLDIFTTKDAGNIERVVGGRR